MVTFLILHSPFMKRIRLWPNVQLRFVFRLLFVFLISALSAFAQTATLRGQVVDQTGAVIPRATITLTDSQGRTTASISSNEGSYVFSGFAPGRYKVQASAPDMAQEPV